MSIIKYKTIENKLIQHHNQFVITGKNFAKQVDKNSKLLTLLAGKGSGV